MSEEVTTGDELLEVLADPIRMAVAALHSASPGAGGLNAVLLISDGTGTSVFSTYAKPDGTPDMEEAVMRLVSAATQMINDRGGREVTHEEVDRIARQQAREREGLRAYADRLEDENARLRGMLCPDCGHAPHVGECGYSVTGDSALHGEQDSFCGCGA